MKNLFLIIVCYCLFVHANDKGNNNTILWSENPQLKWNDFQGIPDPTGTSAEQSESKTEIVVVTKIVKSKYAFNVSCFFEKEKSWTLNDTSQALLGHEQLHFDISELYARDLRKKLKELKNVSNTGIEQKVKDLYHDVITACVAFQKKYDAETEHSRNKTNQLMWKNRVKELLANTAGFSSVNVSTDIPNK